MRPDPKRVAARFVDEGAVNGHWGSSASGLLVTDGSRVLLLRRAPFTQDPNLWGIPGGAIPVHEDTGEKKDSLLSALDEAAEEMGGTPTGRVRGKHEFRDGSFRYTTFIWWVDSIDLEAFTPRLNGEHTAWDLWSVQEAATDSAVHPGVRKVLHQLGGQ